MVTLQLLLAAAKRISPAHAFVRQLPLGALILGQMVEPHAAQHVGCFGELNVLIINDLNAVAPWIVEVEERSFKLCEACLSKSTTSGLLIVDNRTEMTTLVGRLLAPLFGEQ